MKKTTKIIDYYGLIGIDSDLIPNNYNCSKGSQKKKKKKKKKKK